MIFKNCDTETALTTRQNLSSGKPSSAFRDIDNYMTDPKKTTSYLTGSINCAPENWEKMSVSCRKMYRQEGKKPLRHIVLSLSPCDNNIEKTTFMSFIRRVCEYFNGRYYIKYAVHTDTEHIHAHIAICNTAFVDGMQLSFGEAECNAFRDYCNRIAEEFKIKGIDKIDTSSDDPFEVNETRYYENVFFGDTPRTGVVIPYDESDKPVIGNKINQYQPAPTIINVVLPPNAKFTVFPNNRGQYVLSSKPAPYTSEYSSCSGFYDFCPDNYSFRSCPEEVVAAESFDVSASESDKEPKKSIFDFWLTHCCTINIATGECIIEEKNTGHGGQPGQ